MAQTTLQGAATGKKERHTAEILAEKQQSISISEFFTKNRHLLGFDNPRKALLTTVREAVDNSLDACQEMKVLPEIKVIIDETSTDKYKVTVEDNGPGIVRQQIPNIFAKLLYGSKFHRLRQSLTGDEPLLIKKNGEIQIVPIGELVDTFLKNEGEVTCQGIEVPCFDWKTYKYSFQQVSHLIKHKRENEIYKITTLYGKSLKVTGCHSVFTINRKTLKVEEIEARKLKQGDIVLAPKQIPLTETKKEMYSLDFISEDYARKRFWYLYADKEEIKALFYPAQIVHYRKKGDKSRKYYRLSHNGRSIDILDDSYKQYVKKGFLPVWIAIFLQFKPRDGIIQTYYHGKPYTFPLTIELNSLFMKFIGLFVAEGHTEDRGIGFTFSIHERDLVKLVCDFGYSHGIGYTIEERPLKNAVRVKFFGAVLGHVFRNWFGRGARNKKIPFFVFSTTKELRQDFLDYLYVGDGHNTPRRNYLSLCTSSFQLANQTLYLWLFQGIQASFGKRFEKGLRQKADWTYIVNVSGKDIDQSNYFSTQTFTRTRKSHLDLRLLSNMFGREHTPEFLKYISPLSQLDPEKEYQKQFFQGLFDKKKIGYKLRFLLDEEYITQNGICYQLTEKTVAITKDLQKIQKLLDSDFIFLPIRSLERIDEGYEFVYDLSVPKGENFIGGLGGIACHNSRGAQGIGISAAALYGQLTTGKPIKIISKIGPQMKAHYYELHLNTKTNEPE
ncbi:MAG: ATP-binding protein, partial [bacterium]|nr:ATP-binding protein [bacterium]